MARRDATLHDGEFATGTARGGGHGGRDHGGRGGGNAVPILAPDFAATDEDTRFVVRVLANDRDADHDPLRVVAVNPSGTDGVITIPRGGRTIGYDPRGAFDWLPEGATAEDRFGYTASDQRGGLDTSTVTVTVTGVNDAPVARDDVATTDEDTPVTIDVLANDSDIDAGDTLTVVEESGIPGPATSTITPDGRIEYDPGGAFESLAVGESGTDTFTYVIEDALGARAEARVTVTVRGVNDAPVIEGVTFTVDEQQPAQVIGTVPASDPDASDVLTYAIVAGNEAGLFAIDPATGELSTTGPLNFEVRAEYALTIAVADPHGATAEAEVTVAVGDVAGDVLALADLDGSNGFVINGAAAGDRSGFSVSSAGDVNGDGIDDLIIGAPGAGPDGRADAGRSFVVFGGTGIGASGIIDLAGLDGSAGFAIEGTETRARLGFSVSAAGDVNADGIDDLIVGAPGPGGFGNAAASAGFVIFGDRAIGETGRFDLGSLDGSNGFAIPGLAGTAPSDRQLGASVSSAGDINDDGVDDLIIAAEGVSSSGASYVIFGGPDVGGAGIFDLASLDSATGFTTAAPSFLMFLELTNSVVSNAGDVNGDGIDDLIASTASEGSSDGARVTFGGADVGANPTGFSLRDSNFNGTSGLSVGGGGDFNADGFDDLLITVAGGVFGDIAEPGGTFVVFGGPNIGTSAIINLVELDSSEAFRLVDASGPLSFAGDVNNDGVADFISSGSAGVYVVFGGTELGSIGSLAGIDLDGTNGFIIRGPEDGIGLGASVSDAGDVNGDGIADLIIGAPGADPDGRTDAGQSFVVFGRPGGAPLQVADVLGEPDVAAPVAVDPAAAAAAPEGGRGREAAGGFALDSLLTDDGAGAAGF